MTLQADPWWPVVALIAFQVVDGIACSIPTAFITRALDRVDCPAELRPILPKLKLASAAGLAVGLWVPIIGLVTSFALVAYFVIAFGFHLRARDTFISTMGAVAMLAGVSLVTACFVAAA